MYGTLWTNSQGEEPNETWAIGIGQLVNHEIGRGLTALKDGGKPFPPTLPEFMALCRDNGWEHQASRRPAHEVLNAPIIDKGEGAVIAIEDEHTQRARTIGDPSTNSNYFKDLMA